MRTAEEWNDYYTDLVRDMEAKIGIENVNDDAAFEQSTIMMTGMTNEELEQFLHFILSKVTRQIIDHTMNGTLKMNNDNIIQTIVEICIATAAPLSWAVSRSIALEEKDNRKIKSTTGVDAYMTTVWAESVVSTAKENGNINNLWPSEIIQEVTEQHSPDEAFLVGLLCGSHNG